MKSAYSQDVADEAAKQAAAQKAEDAAKARREAAEQHKRAIYHLEQGHGEQEEGVSEGTRRRDRVTRSHEEKKAVVSRAHGRRGRAACDARCRPNASYASGARETMRETRRAVDVPMVGRRSEVENGDAGMSKTISKNSFIHSFILAC